jgi:flavin-dependent dehydrogenase
MKSFDVVIIGAGLAGLQCAKMLGGRGVKVLLVDRKTDLTKGIHTTGIFVRKTLEDFDFPIGTLGKAVRNVKLYSPKLKQITLESDKDEFRVGKMGNLYKSFLQDCVNNGVHFANGTRYVSAKTGAQTLVKLEKNGEMFEVRTKILVGADGAVSRVAKDLGLDENKEWIVGYEEVYEKLINTGEPVLNCFLDAKLSPGYLAWIADDTEEIHIGVGGYPSVFNPREALQIFKNKTIGNVIDLSGACLKETRGGRIPVGGILKSIASTHGLLIGDAAGAVSPLTAGGLDPCLRLSAFATDVIVESLQKNDPRILLNYSGKLFRARFISRLWMRRIIATFTNQTLLEFGFKFLRGKFGQKFAKHVFFGRGSFPDVEIKTNSHVKIILEEN